MKKLIDLEQLSSSLEIVKDYIDETIGNISTGSNTDTNNLTNELKSNYDSAYTHSQSAHAPSNAQKNSDITKAEIEAKLTGTITSHNHSGTYAPVEHGTHLTLGTTSSTAYRGDYGDTAYNHSQAAHAPSNAQKNSDITQAEIENKLTGLIGSHHHDWSTTKGNNTISSISDDTTINWGSQGHSIHSYNTNGLLTDQPSQWAYLLNFGNGNETRQLWFTQPSGSLYHRGGNASGWSGSWREILDSSNYTTYVPKSSESDHSDVYAWVNSDMNMNIGHTITFHNGIYDENWESPYLFGGCMEMDGPPSSNMIFSYASLLPGTIDYFDLGSSAIPWYYCYAYGGVISGSDRTTKENINYIRNNEVSTLSLEDDNGSNGITYSDMYNFIKEDLELATYNFKDKPEEDVQMNFIAQDLLYNLDGTDNKVGQFIVKPKASLTEEEAEAEIKKIETKFNRKLNDNERDRISSPKLDYDRTNFTSVLAGALKETIKQVEELKDIVAQQQELINQLLNNK